MRAFLEKRKPSWTGRARVIRRLLIANRGEIAVRIIRACRELGIETRRGLLGRRRAARRTSRAADSPFASARRRPRESYLNIDARHRRGAPSPAPTPCIPGYGFLSENAAFADACARRGLDLRRPARGGDRAAWDRRSTRARADGSAPACRSCPGETPADQIATRASRRRSTRVGLPGADQGVGRRRRQGHAHACRRRDDRARRFQAARREAPAAFGDGTLYVERLIERPRHVEVQVFADEHGNVVHLFERECSVQRRHQKVIEESPSPALTPALRAADGRRRRSRRRARPATATPARSSSCSRATATRRGSTSSR